MAVIVGEVGERRVIRRFPWMRERDIDELRLITEEEIQREYERILKRQRRADARFYAHETLEPVPMRHLEANMARWTHGAGGGRQKPKAPML